MQACWQIQDSLMTSKHLQTPLLEIHTAFMVIRHTLYGYTFKPLLGIES